MLIYVLSDSHGKIDGFLDTMASMPKPDMIFFLGDYVEDIEEIKKVTDIKIIGVRGNNDFKNKDYPLEDIVDVNGYKILLSHGHLYDVGFDINNLYYKSLELKVDLTLFGHTHRQFKLVENGLILLNPGSCSYPRGVNPKKSFLELKITNGIEYRFVVID